MVKAFLKNYRQSPRKVRLITDLIKGKKVSRALTILDNTNKRSSPVIKKLINSALSSAKQQNLKEEELIVKNITVDEGQTLKRIRPRAQGRAYSINKRTSRVFVELAEIKASLSKAVTKE